MVKQLYLFRHGQTNENADGIRYGDASGGYLTETGIAQANELAATLADAQINAIYSSPFERAVHTAKIVGTHHPDAQIFTDDRLVEGVYFWWGPEAQEPKWVAKNAATYERVSAALRDILAGDFDTVAISSHGGITRALLMALGHQIGEIKNCECYHLVRDGESWRIVDK